MLLKRFAQLATVSSLAVAFTLGTPALSFADEKGKTEVILEEAEEGDSGPLFDENGVPRPDEGGTPRKKVRIRVRRPQEGKKGLRIHVDALAKKPLNLHFKKSDSKSPVDSVQRWLLGRLGDGLSSGQLDPSAILKQWFDGGKDVPLAGLRDTLKADGWNAKKLGGWLGEQFANALPQIMQRFAAGHAGPGRARGGFTMGRHGMRGQAGCPTCGTGPFTRGPSANGPRPFNFGRSTFGHPGHGFQGRGFYGQGFRGQGFRGQGPMGGWQMFGGPGPRGQGFPGFNMPHGRMGPQNAHSRTVIMWNDGSGWHRQEMPGPMMGGHASQGQGGPGHGQRHGGVHPGHGPMGGMGMPGHGHGQKHGGMHPQGRHPQGGAKKDMPWMQMFRQLQPGQKGPHGSGNVSIGGHSLDPKHMKLLMDLLGGLGMEEGGDQHGSFDLNQLKKMLQGMHGAHKDGAQPKVRVKIVGPKGKMRVVEEKREDSIQRDGR